MKPDASALVSRLMAELEDLEQVAMRAEALANKARERKDSDYLDGVALNLHGFYAGAERTFEEIAREIDGSVPSGPEWHRDLLMQMSAEVPGTRPSVLRRDTRNCLDEYRGFRHVVRNVYTLNLRASRIYELADDVRTCLDALAGDIRTFCDFLEQLE